MKRNKGNTNMWIAVGVLNAVVIYLGALLFPALVVLGNDSIPGLLAVILISILLTLLLTLVPALAATMKLKSNSVVSMNLQYGVVNIAGLWILAKFAKYLGFGISSFWVAIMLGAFLTIVQYLLCMSLAKKK